MPNKGEHERRGDAGEVVCGKVDERAGLLAAAAPDNTCRTMPAITLRYHNVMM